MMMTDGVLHLSVNQRVGGLWLAACRTSLREPATTKDTEKVTCTACLSVMARQVEATLTYPIAYDEDGDAAYDGEDDA